MQLLQIEAKKENLERVQSFINEILEQNDCGMKAQIQIEVAVEEIFVNIASYAYAPETGEAEIEAGVTDGVLTMVFRDNGIPYDPLAKPDPDITLSAEERQIGGLGIFMVKKSMDNMTYRYVNGQNVLTIEKAIR